MGFCKASVAAPDSLSLILTIETTKTMRIGPILWQILQGVSRIREAGILVALIVLAAATALLNPRFLSAFNLQILTRQIAIYCKEE